MTSEDPFALGFEIVNQAPASQELVDVYRCVTKTGRIYYWNKDWERILARPMIPEPIGEPLGPIDF